MNATELMAKMNEKFGWFVDTGVVHCNDTRIVRIVWEIDWYTLYETMKGDVRYTTKRAKTYDVVEHILYVVHHPVGDFEIEFAKTMGQEYGNPYDDVDTYLLPFFAQKHGLNLVVAHTQADKMLEDSVNAWLFKNNPKTKAGLERLQDHFTSISGVKCPPIRFKSVSDQRLKTASIKAVLATYGYKKDRKVVVIDESGMEEENSAVLVPHSVVDYCAMSLWEKAAYSLYSLP